VTALGGSHGYKYEEEVAKEFRRNEAPKSSYLWLFQKRESSALLVPHKSTRLVSWASTVLDGEIIVV
jgi:hypothetical protein